MNRQSDYGIDFYLQAIVLYRNFSGPLPLQADDPLKWLHCHISRQLMPDLCAQGRRQAALIATQDQRIFLTS